MANNYTPQIEESIRFLSSTEALKLIEADPYWPKWNSPWWHMLLLYEMGDVKRIPPTIVHAFVDALNKIPLKIFPILPSDLPEGVDPYRGTPCHCQLGTVYQVLASLGLNVDQELPWIRPWLLRYQMPDGGLNCDNEAYLVKDEVPSSMVGTISAFEAILLYTSRAWTVEETAFLTRAANFLMARKLMLGSPTIHNASERKSAENWMKLCFPRFYFYDVLRGLNALLIWAEKTNQIIDPDSIRDVVNLISKKFPDGQIFIERQSYEGVNTILQSKSGEWTRGQPSTFFPLLASVSKTGEVSPFLSKQWQLAKEKMQAKTGLLTI